MFSNKEAQIAGLKGLQEEIKHQMRIEKESVRERWLQYLVEEGRDTVLSRYTGRPFDKEEIKNLTDEALVELILARNPYLTREPELKIKQIQQLIDVLSTQIDEEEFQKIQKFLQIPLVIGVSKETLESENPRMVHRFQAGAMSGFQLRDFIDVGDITELRIAPEHQQKLIEVLSPMKLVNQIPIVLDHSLSKSQSRAEVRAGKKPEEGEVEGGREETSLSSTFKPPASSLAAPAATRRAEVRRVERITSRVTSGIAVQEANKQGQRDRDDHKPQQNNGGSTHLPSSFLPRLLGGNAQIPRDAMTNPATSPSEPTGMLTRSETRLVTATAVNRNLAISNRNFPPSSRLGSSSIPNSTLTLAEDYVNPPFRLLRGSLPGSIEKSFGKT